MEKPWIGIPTRFHPASGYIGQIRHYLDAVIDAGGVPLMIPTINSPELMREYMRHLDGVLLPGSPTDVDPAHYGVSPHPKLGTLYPERDGVDFALLKHAES